MEYQAFGAFGPLPSDIWLNILTLLSPPDILSTALMSHSFSTFVLQSPVWKEWSSLCPTRYKPDSMDWEQARFIHHCGAKDPNNGTCRIRLLENPWRQIREGQSGKADTSLPRLSDFLKEDVRGTRHILEYVSGPLEISNFAKTLTFSRFLTSTRAGREERPTVPPNQNFHPLPSQPTFQTHRIDQLNPRIPPRKYTVTLPPPYYQASGESDRPWMDDYVVYWEYISHPLIVDRVLDYHKNEISVNFVPTGHPSQSARERKSQATDANLQNHFYQPPIFEENTQMDGLHERRDDFMSCRDTLGAHPQRLLFYNIYKNHTLSIPLANIFQHPPPLSSENLKRKECKCHPLKWNNPLLIPDEVFSNTNSTTSFQEDCVILRLHDMHDIHVNSADPSLTMSKQMIYGLSYNLNTQNIDWIIPMENIITDMEDPELANLSWSYHFFGYPTSTSKRDEIKYVVRDLRTGSIIQTFGPLKCHSSGHDASVTVNQDNSTGEGIGVHPLDYDVSLSTFFFIFHNPRHFYSYSLADLVPAPASEPVQIYSVTTGQLLYTLSIPNLLNLPFSPKAPICADFNGIDSTERYWKFMGWSMLLPEEGVGEEEWEEGRWWMVWDCVKNLWSVFQMERNAMGDADMADVMELICEEDKDDKRGGRELVFRRARVEQGWIRERW